MYPGILPEDDWSFTFREKIWPLIDENKFKSFYDENKGAPNISIKLKISLLIFMALEKLNWRQAEFTFARRIDWMNATFTAFGEAFIDHTTLFNFFQLLEKDDTAYKLFVDLTSRFIEECNVSTNKQRIDSFFMLGWLATLSRYGLFKETIRVFLQALRKNKPGLYETIKDELSKDYLKDNFDLTEKDKEKANKKIKEMAQDLYLVKSAFENHKQVKHYETFKTLLQVFEQQCSVKKDGESSTKDEKATLNSDKKIKECTEVSTKAKETKHNPGKVDTEISEFENKTSEDSNSDNTLPEIEIRKKPQGNKIISSPHNTDAAYTRKRNKTVVGHKGFVTETCDPNNEVQFITDLNLEVATHSDAKEISKVEQRLDDNGLKPETLYGDAGFVNGKSILESETKDIDLAGPSSGRSQSFEDYEKEDRPHDIADFEVEINDETKELKILSCPKKQEPLDQERSEKTGKIIVHFDRDICAQCSSQNRCPVKIGVRTSTLTVNEEQYTGAARHDKYMSDPEYRKECGIRSGAESLVNEVANGHGTRRSKHKTEERSKLQLIFASIACNVKRYIRYMDKCVQNQPEMAV
ncbi:MAG: transposase [Bacteroidetes bacterium]|nr:transposase [Bacteroidota bacterium]